MPCSDCAAAVGNPKPRHYFVIDQQGSVPLGLFAQHPQKLCLWSHTPHVSHHRFQNDSGDRIAPLLERLFDAGHIVVSQDERILSGASGDSGRVGNGQGRGGAACGHQQAVDVTVVVSRELDDPVAARRTPRQANRTHRRLGPGIHEPDFFDGRHGLGDHRRQFVLCFRWRAEACAMRGCLLDRLHNIGMRMPQNHRSPGSDVVEVTVAIDVEQVGSLPTADNDRFTSHGAEGACGAIDSSGNQLTGTGKQFVTPSAVHRLAFYVVLSEEGVKEREWFEDQRSANQRATSLAQ